MGNGELIGGETNTLLCGKAFLVFREMVRNEICLQHLYEFMATY